jgi:hypothetical protein
MIVINELERTKKWSWSAPEHNIQLILVQKRNEENYREPQNHSNKFDIHMSVHRNIITNYSQQDATFLEFIYFYRCSTCFRRFLRPYREHITVHTVSGILLLLIPTWYTIFYKLHEIKFLYMFRASSTHPHEVNDVNCIRMQPLVSQVSGIVNQYCC